jgi:hypothetical protein
MLSRTKTNPLLPRAPINAPSYLLKSEFQTLLNFVYDDNHTIPPEHDKLTANTDTVSSNSRTPIARPALASGHIILDRLVQPRGFQSFLVMR